MITGYNANVDHGGRVFHVQTEDSGRANPRVVTHLYYEGTILASERRDYAEIVDAPDLVSRVRRLMEEQHAAVVEALRRGEFDDVIAARLCGPPRAASAVPSETETPPATPAEPTLRASGTPARAAAEPPADGPAAGARAFGEGIVSERPLDAVILDYLIAKSRERSGGGRGSRSGG